MEVLYIFYFLFLFLIILVMLMITIFHFYYISYEEKEKGLDEKYKDDFINYSFDDTYDFNFELKEIKHVKNAAVSLMSSFTGNIRRKIIDFCDEKGIVEYVFKYYKKTKRITLKRLLLHDLGQLRCKTYFRELLNEDIDEMIEKDIILAYFLSILLIAEEWLSGMEQDLLRAYIDKIVSVIDKVAKQKSSKMKRIIDYFYNKTEKLFNYLIDYPEEKEHFLKKAFEKEISLEAKGVIIYVMAVNHQHSIFSYIKSEFMYYMEKENKTPYEIDYLANLVKSTGELKIDEGFEIIKMASQSDFAILKIICSKYLEFYETGSELMNNMLFDKTWHVRYNAAIAFAKMEDKGIEHLMKVLKSDDKYAREISAHAITNSYYGKYIIKEIEKGKLQEFKDKIDLIINKGNSMKLLDFIFRSKKIELKDKLEILDLVENVTITDYYSNILSNFKIDVDLRVQIEKKIKDIYREELLI